MSDKKPHLQFEVTERGFAHLPAIPGSYGGKVFISESSNAEHPHIWLTTERSGEQVSVALHLTVEDAQALAEQLLFLRKEHYQGHDDESDFDGRCGCNIEFYDDCGCGCEN